MATEFEYSLTRSGYRDLQQNKRFFYHLPNPGTGRAMCKVKTPHPLAKRHLSEYPKGALCDRCKDTVK